MRILLFLLIVTTPKAWAESFDYFVQKINEHEMIRMMNSSAAASREMGVKQGSWGDPTFKIAANNFPKDSLKKDETPMTGIQFSIMQKFGLTTKYGNLEKSFKALAEAIEMDREHGKRLLFTELWNLAIELEKTEFDLEIYKENLEWIQKMLGVSKKLYSNGKLAQQGLLDIQIRKAQLETDISNSEHKKNELFAMLGYIAGAEESKNLDIKSVPWKIMEKSNLDDLDFQEKKLVKELDSAGYNLKSSKQNFVPDLTVGLAYTQRANIDRVYDFVGASVSFPLPLSSTKYANYSEAVHRKSAKERSLRNYRLKRNSELQMLEHSLKKLSEELDILNKKTINFARSSRDVTSRSYRLGRATYIELLNSELQLQQYLIKRNDVKKKLKGLKVKKKLVSGGALK